MHKLYELKEKLMSELEDYADNGKFSKDDVEAIKYTASAIDHICNIMESADEEYSGNMYGGSMNDGMGGRSYMGGSYARGGSRGGNRRGGRRGGANQYGSYASGGYSRASENLAMELKELMNEAPDENVRQEMHALVQRLERM